MPVDAIPSTRYFCMVRNMMKIGTRDSVAIANIAPQSDPTVGSENVSARG